MAPVNKNPRFLRVLAATIMALAIAAAPALHAQSTASQQPQPQSQDKEKDKDKDDKGDKDKDIPDAPSTVQPPPEKSSLPTMPQGPTMGSTPVPTREASQQVGDQQQPPPPMPPVQTVPPGTAPRNQINPKEELYKLVVPVNFVQIPVLVKYPDGRRVDGLLASDFTVLENGKRQTLSFFSSDPFELSVAIVLDTGMPDVAFQKINQTYSALLGAFSPYDEVALYTYSSTVSQASDFAARPERLQAVLNEMKLVRGHNNGPPVLGGPLGPGGPTVNGAPVGGPLIQPVSTPEREGHVLNDAILRAALDLSKREKTRRKVIFVISDGRELGSRASYRDVLKVLETRDIQVKAVVVDSGALPLFKQVGKIHMPGQGYSDILPKYSSATGGGAVLTELSRNAIEDAYAQVTSEARNQYTLAYTPKAGAGAAYRNIEVQVARKGLKVFAKDGYYPIAAPR